MSFFSSLVTVTVKTTSVIQHQHWAITILAAIVSAFVPIKGYIYFLMILLVIDAITSIYYQYSVKLLKCGKKGVPAANKFRVLFSTIESNRLRQTFVKLVAYIIGLYVVSRFDMDILQTIPAPPGVGNPFTLYSITNLTAMLICSVEVFSILENLGKITNNPIYKRIAALLQRKIGEHIPEEQP